jgi:hypothetical protein
MTRKFNKPVAVVVRDHPPGRRPHAVAVIAAALTMLAHSASPAFAHRGRGVLLVASLLTASLLPLAPSSGAVPLSTLAPAAAFLTDPTGDSGNAPDITEVSVGNDVVAGPIVIWVDTPNRTSLGSSDLVSVFLDTDLNRSTGAAEYAGAEYSIDRIGGQHALFRWAGSEWAQVPAPTLSTAFFRGQKALRVSIHPNDLGGTRAFNYYIFSAVGDQSGDYAPNGGVGSYSLISGPVRLSVERFSVTPRVPRAGKSFAATMLVGREDINEILEEGSASCSLRVGKRAVAARIKGFVNGAAACRWTIPKNAKGQQLSVMISVKFGGASISRRFAAKVR